MTRLVLLLAATALFAGEPDYRAYVQQSLPAPAPFRHKPGATYGADYARAAAVHTYVWQWTGRQEYAQTALEVLRTMADNWERGDDFFALHPYLVAYRKLDGSGLLDETLRKRVRALVLEKYRPGQRGNHNQTACRIAGVALALQTFPDLPDAATLRDYVTAGWNDWYAIRDTIENAPNYNRIFWEMMFHVADLTNRTSLLNDPQVKHVFERYRDQVTPGGVIPGVGDSAAVHRDSNWISVFERAAAFYQDPTLRWAALQLAQLPAPDPEASRRSARTCGELLSFCYADAWRDRRLAPKMPDSRAAVLTRATPKRADEPDQIILNPTRASGAPYAMIELFAQQGGHAHPEWGALQYFETGNTPLLHGLGYNSRMTPHSNLVMLRPPGDLFPYKPMPFEPNVWYEATVPLRGLAHFDTFIFRVENGGQRPNNSPAMFAWVDNLRLAGLKGEKLLDDFETGAQERWKGGTSRELSTDAKQGKTSLKVECPGGVTFLNRSFDVGIDPAEHQYVKFDWKLSSTRSALTRPFIMRLLDRGRDYSVSIVDPPIPAVVRDAEAAMQGDDSYGETTIDPYFTAGTKLRRRAILTREGVLAVCDTITPGKDAEGWTAGPIWHLFSPPKPGPNWFDAERLLVVFDKQCATGVQEASLAGGVHPYTVYAKQTLKAGVPAQFTTVLVPRGKPVSAADVVMQGEAVSVKGIRIRFGALSDWEVTR